MTDAEKLAAIRAIVYRQADELNADDGDKYLSQPEYALEAIEAVLDDQSSFGILRAFLTG